jgi:hypothetical protein
MAAIAAPPDQQIADAAAAPHARPSIFHYLIGIFSRSSSQPRHPAAYSSLPLPSSSRLDASLNDVPFDCNHPVSSSKTVLYLAYGSNLCYETFQGRRGIRPLSAINVVVRELKLTFNLPGVPYIEPCFANSARRDADALNPGLEDATESETSEWTLVHNVAKLPESTKLMTDQAGHSMHLIGVVYEVTSDDYARIIATEGSKYTDIVVTCNALPTFSNLATDFPKEKTFKAHTLLAPPSAARRSPSGKPAQPSLRYLTLCRNGAAEHNLPPEWQSYLGNLQHYQITTLRQKVGRSLFTAIFTPFFLLMMALRMHYGKGKDEGPKWLIYLSSLFFKSVWRSYDWVFRPVFGEGERTEDGKDGFRQSKF